VAIKGEFIVRNAGSALRSSLSIALTAVVVFAFGLTAPAFGRSQRHPRNGLAVSVRVALAASHSNPRITVGMHARAGAKCTLTVYAAHAKHTFPTLLVDRAGRAGLRWIVPTTAPSGNWLFSASCSNHALSGKATKHVLVITLGGRDGRGKRHHALVANSTTTLSAGELGLGSAGGPDCDASNTACFPYPSLWRGSGGYLIGQCTWYAMNRRPDLSGKVEGNAGSWYEAARKHGLAVGATPAPGAVAVWFYKSKAAPAYGHVAIVDEVGPGGRSVEVQDSNWQIPYPGPELTYHQHWVSGEYMPNGYIYGTSIPQPTPVPITPAPGPPGTNGYQLAFQANTNELIAFGGSATSNTGQGMMPGTSPSIAALPGGGYEMAFQANTGNLIVYGTGGNSNTQQGMKAGTSPSIAASPQGGFQVAFQANTGNLYTYNSATGPANLQQGMDNNTSPSIAP
jgi:surface antigen